MMNSIIVPTPVPVPRPVAPIEQVRQLLALLRERMEEYLNAGVPRDQVTDYAELALEALKMAVTGGGPDGVAKAVEFFNTRIGLTFTHKSLQ